MPGRRKITNYSCLKNRHQTFLGHLLSLLPFTGGSLPNKESMCVITKVAESIQQIKCDVKMCPASTKSNLQNIPLWPVCCCCFTLSASSLSISTLRREQIKDGGGGVCKTKTVSLQVTKIVQRSFTVCSSFQYHQLFYRRYAGCCEQVNVGNHMISHVVKILAHLASVSD